jgi:transcriptional regulator with XRE-family HTH domain
MTLNEAVRNLRAFTENSQQSFAQRLGLSLRAVANYEKDRSPNSPALYRLAKLAQEVGRPDLAQLFSKALSEELHGSVEPMRRDEKAWSDAVLALIRNKHLGSWSRLAPRILRSLEKLVRARPHDQQLAEILIEARYSLTDEAERRLEQLARDRQQKTGEFYQAYTEVLTENPELYAQYQEARAQAAKGTMLEKTMPTSHRQHRKKRPAK